MTVSGFGRNTDQRRERRSVVDVSPTRRRALRVRRQRRIGPIGTTARFVLGLALLALALADQPAGIIAGLELYELVLGLVAFPARIVVISPDRATLAP